jgi:hypothetical protein
MVQKGPGPARVMPKVARCFVLGIELVIVRKCFVSVTYSIV